MYAENGYSPSMTAASSADQAGPEWDWADRLRKIRRTIACVSQGEMATMLGVKPATYSAWEGGRNHPPMRLAFQVAQRIEQCFPGRVTATWVLGLDTLTGGSLPRMDSNHQPCDYGSHHLKISSSGRVALIKPRQA